MDNSIIRNKEWTYGYKYYIYIFLFKYIYICICCQANIRAANCKLFVSFNSDVSIPSARIYTQKPDWYSNYTFQISWHQIKFRSMTNQPEKCNYNLNLVWFIKMKKNSTIFFRRDTSHTNFKHFDDSKIMATEEIIKVNI